MSQKKQQDTANRIAQQVREAAELRGVTKSQLRDALGLTDWRPIAMRWNGTIAYTVTELAILAALLDIQFRIPEDA